MNRLFAAVAAVFLANTLSVAQISLLSTVPHQNAVNIALDETPLMEFNQSVNASTAFNAFVIESDLRGKLSYSVVVQGSSVKIIPATPFIASEQITITVLSVLKSTSGAALSVPSALRFETSVKAAPADPLTFLNKVVVNMPTDRINRISAADLDGDSDIDIAFFGGSVGWLRNDGNGVFATNTITTVSDFPQDIKTVDIDLDGDVDIITAAQGNGIIIYANDGTGQFSVSANLRVVTPSRIDVADLNMDGYSDIVFSALELENEMYVNGTYIFFQDVAGAFIKKKINVEYSYMARCVDLDKDGDWDVLQHDDERVYYLENQGANFVSRPIAQAAFNIQDLCVVNVNNDEHDDLVLYMAEDGKFSLQLLTGDGDNFSMSTVSSTYGLDFLSAGDFDGDGDSDINFINGDYDYVMAVNAGNGNFENRLLNIKGETPWAAANAVNADFNGDGDLDFAFVSSGARIELFDNTLLPFSIDQSSVITPPASDADWGDFDNDGDLDLITTGVNMSTSKSEARLYKNDAGEFQSIPTSMTAAQLTSCDWGDFDNDGDLDLLTFGAVNTNAQDSRTLIYRNDNEVFTLLASNSSQMLKAGRARWADMNNDGLLDIVSPNEDAGIYASNGKGDFAKVVELPYIFQAGNIAIGDYDKDGDQDLALSGWTGNEETGAILKVFRNDGNWTLSEVSGEFVGIYGGKLHWADLDSDGDLDLVASGFRRFTNGGGISSMNIYRNENESFKNVENSGPLLNINAEGTSAAADYDNDGDADLIASPGYEPVIRLLKNDGQGNLAIADIRFPATTARILTWGDADGDNDLDIFTGIDLLHNNGDRKNSPPTAPTSIRIDSVFNNTIYLQWDAAMDAETSQAGLSYELYTGTQSKAHDIAAPHADIATGVRTVAEPGSISGTRGYITNLQGGTYYFGVQSIDGAFAASAFSEEGSVSVIGIHGPSSSCAMLENSYSAFPAGNYTWQVVGGTILSGQGSDKVLVQWTEVGKGYLKVSAGTGQKNTLVVFVDDKPQPVIAGAEKICSSSQSYSIADHRSHSFEWKVSGVAQEESSSTLTLALENSGDYSIDVITRPKHKGCFSEANFLILVDKRPDPTITGGAVACEGMTRQYSTLATNPDWTVTGGVLANNFGSSIDVRWEHGGEGKVTVDATSDRGFCVEHDELSVFVDAYPPKPTLMIVQDTILYTPTISPSGEYSWYYDEFHIVKGPYNALIPNISASFTVTVFSLWGCSRTSDPLYFQYVGDVTAVEGSLAGFNVYPNPVDDILVLELPKGTSTTFTLEIYSAANPASISLQYTNNDLVTSHQVNVSRLAPGVYIAILRTKTGTLQTRFVKL